MLPAFVAVVGFLVAGLVAWPYSDRLADLLGFCLFFVLLVLAVGMYAGFLFSGCKFPCCFVAFAALEL